MTDPGELFADPFGGSTTAGMGAEGLGRRWIIGDEVEEYLQASRFRFDTFLD